MSSDPNPAQQEGINPEKWPQDEKSTHSQHGQQQRQQSVDSSESESLYEIQPVRSERQVHPEYRGTGDGMLTPQISRMSHNSLARRVTTRGTTGTTDPNFEVDWDGEDDPQNPWNWSLPYTAMCIAFLSYNTLVMYVITLVGGYIFVLLIVWFIVSCFQPVIPPAQRKSPKNSASPKQSSHWV